MLNWSWDQQPRGSGAEKTVAERALELWNFIQLSVFQVGAAVYEQNRRVVFEDFTLLELEDEARFRVSKLEERSLQPIPAWAGGLQQEVRSVYAQAISTVGWIAAVLARGGNPPGMAEVLSALVNAMTRIYDAANQEFARMQQRIDELQEVAWWQQIFREFGDLAKAIGSAVDTALQPAKRGAAALGHLAGEAMDALPWVLGALVVGAGVYALSKRKRTTRR